MTEDHDLRALRFRVERLEHLVVQVTCWAACLLLVVGSLLDYITARNGSDEQEVTPRLLTTGFHAIGYRNDEGDTDGFTIAVGIGFLGLMVVTLVVVWLLLAIAAGSTSDRTVRLLGIALTLMLIGTAVAGVFTLIGLGSDDYTGYDVGWGIVVFAAGGALCLALFSRDLRRWWDPALAA
ncbi:hypothetical protein [Nocardioides plantarum]|uniref:Integral membrane protein n=1 Tax=Nocardioides plantarum TaxID=29299 RepID=A0ABV5K642_9ACTN|nr:hypothetical protein [Nocardioides plantarum]